MDVFPKLLEQDVSFYGHEIAEYWNDVGSLRGVPPGQLRRARRARCSVDMPAELTDGAHGARRLAEVEGPVFIGEGCEIAAGVRLTGPVVIGEGCAHRRGLPRCATRSSGRAPRSIPAPC